MIRLGGVPLSSLETGIRGSSLGGRRTTAWRCCSAKTGPLLTAPTAAARSNATAYITPMLFDLFCNAPPVTMARFFLAAQQTTPVQEFTRGVFPRPLLINVSRGDANIETVRADIPALTQLNYG